MTNNTRIWSQVEKTDPRHTKKVNQRGGFTAIEAHYQIMRATEVFGPVGDGWGYDCAPPIFHGDFIIIPVTLWHGDRSTVFGPVYGCAQILGGRPDFDAPKKAMTDAITKGLSHLGFNADVFLGKFDDNKYVAEVNQEFRKAEQKPLTAERFDAMASPQAEHDRIMGLILGANTYDDLFDVWNAAKESIAAIVEQNRDLGRSLYHARDARKNELTHKKEAAA